jgi:hypothetical protein
VGHYPPVFGVRTSIKQGMLISSILYHMIVGFIYPSGVNSTPELPTIGIELFSDELGLKFILSE